MVRAARLLSYAALALGALSLGAAAAPHNGVSPQSAVGPRAQPANIASPSYGLFTCQVIGRSPDTTCYDPYQMRTAYGLDKLIASGYDGAGHTIVIVDAFQSPTLAHDLGTFTLFYGLPAANLTQIAPDGLTPFDPTNASMVSWASEITLDVEWAHATAPAANIVLVLAKSNQDEDILNALKYAVDHNLGDVISMSFGENESCVDPLLLSGYHDVFADATRKSITLFASSGDQGAAQQTCNGESWIRAVSSPASDALVSGVGGTELHAARYCLTALGCDPAANPPTGTYQSEIVWSEFGSEATGGGVSVLFDEPPYQKSAVKSEARGVPDVSYNAAILHGVLVYWSGANPATDAGFYLFGGTSAGSPPWAGITVIANQVAGHRLGFLNKAFYQIRQTPPNYGPSFHDITSGNNSVIETDADGNDVVIAGFVAGTAWDATTGVGSPKVDGIVGRLIQTVSPGDGNSAIATSKPHSHGKPPKPGSMGPH
jgi:subtilase family serine protease